MGGYGLPLPGNGVGLGTMATDPDEPAAATVMQPLAMFLRPRALAGPQRNGVVKVIAVATTRSETTLTATARKGRLRNVNWIRPINPRPARCLTSIDRCPWPFGYGPPCNPASNALFAGSKRSNSTAFAAAARASVKRPRLISARARFRYTSGL